MSLAMSNKKIQGALLRIERLRQNKGQKEICFGICVPSYLSKIEHGTVCPDDVILTQLFEKLGIVYQCEEAILIELQRKIEQYFYHKSYEFETKSIYEDLVQQEQVLRYSELAIDWLLIQGLEGKAVLDELQELEDCMEQKQRAYYNILRFRSQPEKKEALVWCKEAAQILNDCFSYMQVMWGHYLQGDYAAIHQLENRFTAIALEEGNTYYLADYYFMKGSAYACLNMEAMMMECYQKSIRFLQNTGWKEELGAYYYNIGATFISLQKYDEAIAYLEKAEVSGMTYHKLALAYIRSGRVEQGREFLEKMKIEIEKEDSNQETEMLRYQEACMECERDFLDQPEYLELLEKLIASIKKNYPFGHLYFYKDVVVEAYKRQRKYKKALEFEEEISCEVVKNHT